MDIHESIESIESYLGEKKDCNIHLIWQEKFSQFNHQYIIEKSIDGVEWIELGIGKISTQESIAQNFEWLDTSNTFEKAYYRLKYIDPFGL